MIEAQLSRIIESSPVIVVMLMIISVVLWRKLEAREMLWEQQRKDDIAAREAIMGRMIASEQQMTRAVEQLVVTLKANG